MGCPTWNLSWLRLTAYDDTTLNEGSSSSGISKFRVRYLVHARGARRYLPGEAEVHTYLSTSVHAILHAYGYARIIVVISVRNGTYIHATIWRETENLACSWCCLALSSRPIYLKHHPFRNSSLGFRNRRRRVCIHEESVRSLEEKGEQQPFRFEVVRLSSIFHLSFLAMIIS